MADRSARWPERTIWSRERTAPLRAFLSTESGSAGVLLAAALVALVWANIDVANYESIWHAEFSVRLGDMNVSRDVRTWINSGLMTLFFLVVGLEARREFDLGDLRERRRFALPFLAGLVGMAIPAAIYLVVNAGHSSAHGWGVALSTDTALVLGLLVLLGRDVPDRARVFLLTLSIVDDLAALVVIAVVYTDGLDLTNLGVAVGCSPSCWQRRSDACSSGGSMSGSALRCGRPCWPAESIRSSLAWQSGCWPLRTPRPAGASRRRRCW